MKSISKTQGFIYLLISFVLMLTSYILYIQNSDLEKYVKYLVLTIYLTIYLLIFLLVIKNIYQSDMIDFMDNGDFNEIIISVLFFMIIFIYLRSKILPTDFNDIILILFLYMCWIIGTKLFVNFSSLRNVGGLNYMEMKQVYSDNDLNESAVFIDRQ
jgi:FlaA1/EpsC-like NDP-sugar epimerase